MADCGVAISPADAAAAGMDDYISKPVDFEKLEMLLRTVVGSS